jgi:hypothetical protein
VLTPTRTPPSPALVIGFRDGPAAIPEWWIEPLRQRERIESLAED